MTELANFALARLDDDERRFTDSSGSARIADPQGPRRTVPDLQAVVIIVYQNVHLTGHELFPISKHRPRHESLLDPRGVGRRAWLSRELDSKVVIMADTVAEHRSGFHSLHRSGLNYDSLPMRLFTKGNAKFWNPADIDIEGDRADWDALTEAQQQAVTGLCCSFMAGEEAVTEDIRPFVGAMSAEGRFADEMYLTQFAFEEAKHTETFRRWLNTVGLTEDLQEFAGRNPHYRRLFYAELPESLHLLAEDPSPLNQVRASVTYNHVIEGVLALTGYYSWHRICLGWDILPGMQEIIRRIGDDERRHMAWGTFTCRRHVAADDSLWDAVQRRMNELLEIVMASFKWSHETFGPSPFGLAHDDTLNYATDRAQRRLRAIESARGTPVAQIDLDHSPEQLEEQFGREDAEALAQSATH